MMSESVDILQLFRPPNVQAPLHYISDLAYWQKLFHTEADINQNHERDVARLIHDNVAAMKKSSTPKDSEGGNKFMDSMKAFIDRLTDQKEEYGKYASEFYQTEGTIAKHKDKWCKHIESYDNQLKHLQKKLEHKSARLETYRKNYHKLRFMAEKQALKVKLSLKEDVGHKAKKRGEKASERAHVIYDRYEKGIEAWNKLATDARLLSDEFENAYIERELERTELVMAALEKMEIPRDRKPNRNLKFGEFAFSGMDVRSMIEHLATGEECMRNIECPRLQEYDTSKELVTMYEEAKRELSVEEAGQTDHIKHESDIDLSVDSESDDDVRKILSDEDLNKILAKDRKYKYFVVTAEYIKQDGTEISLKLGERVKQLLPPNAKGLAFGEVKHGVLHKKKKGFYPINNTRLMTTLNAEDDKVNERKKKLAKKYQKTIKNTKTKENTTEHTAKEQIVTTSNGLRKETQERNEASENVMKVPDAVECARGSSGAYSRRDRYA